MRCAVGAGRDDCDFLAPRAEGQRTESRSGVEGVELTKGPAAQAGRLWLTRDPLCHFLRAGRERCAQLRARRRALPLRVRSAGTMRVVGSSEKCADQFCARMKLRIDSWARS